MFDIFELIPGQKPTIKVVDVGAMSLGAGTDPFDPLLKQGSVKIVGFEPVQAECDKLNRMHAPGRLYLPHVIGDGRKRTFHECNHVMTSSLYEPYTELLDKFQNLENLTQVVSRSDVDTRRLDDIVEVADTDYLKVDVQGAEVDVFNGATNVLREAVMVHTEVEFVPMYRDQPLFAEVDQVMRRNGFLFHKFAGIMGRTFKPLISNNDVNAPGSQLLWGDAVYIKNFMSLDDLVPEKLLKLAILLHVLHRSFDACAFVLQCYQRKTQDKLADRYLFKLTGGR
jgi:FkbM family methyltransferase